MNDHVLICGVNVFLQVTVAAAVALSVAACLRRESAVRYGVLCSALVVVLFCPGIALVMQWSGRSLVSVATTGVKTGLTPDSTPASANDGISNGPLDAFTIESPRADFLDEMSPSREVIASDDREEALATNTGVVSSNGLSDLAPLPHVPDPEPWMAQHGAGLQTGVSARPQDEPSFIAVYGGLVHNVIRLLLWVWFVGTLALFARLALNWWRLGRILHSALPNTDRALAESLEQAGQRLGVQTLPDLVLSNSVSGPIAAGVFRPRIVLPTRLAEQVSKTHVGDILIHELAHVLRRDQIVVLLQNIAGAVYWLHPLAVWLNRALARAREEVCDNYVLASTNAPSYSRTLLTLAELMQISHVEPGAVGMLTSRWKLENRVAGLLDKRRSHMVDMTKRSKILVAGLALGMATIAGLGTVTLAVSQDPEQQPRSERHATAANERASTATTAEPRLRKTVTMRGTGKNREMLIRGRVLDADGQSANGYELLINLKRHLSGLQQLSLEIAGNQFEVWVPVGGSVWSNLELSASADDGRRRMFHGVPNWGLRQAAIDRIELRLEPTTRDVEVSVTNDGVPVAHAHVTAQLRDNLLLNSATDGDGRAVFHLIDGEGVSRLSVWTDRHEIGGYQFDRKPRHDPFGSQFTIELDDCRNQTIRLVDAEDDSPIPDVQFALTIGTGPPNYNFPGTPDTLPGCRMTTDERGEATYPLFPDWESHGSYVEIIDPHWARASREIDTDDDGALVVKLKRRIDRKPLLGQVASDDADLGGFLLEIDTFQAEEEGHVDRVYAVTDGDGRFTVDCLPGATYCVCVVDDRYSSNIIDVIPFEPSTGTSNTAELQLSLGRPVEIRLTSGPDRKPVANQSINLRTEHNFTWIEGGKTRHGGGGRQWNVSTDENGIARTWALAGSELEANVYAGEWRSGAKRVTVYSDRITTIEFHRRITTEREVTGRLLPPDADVDVASAEIIFGSVDGETDERHTGRTDEQGRFAFTTKALRFGVFAYTADGKAAGVATSEDVEQPLDVALSRTASLHGQLLGPDGSPLGHHAVRVRPEVRGKRDRDKAFAMSFAAKSFEATTDHNGHFSFEKLPSELDMTLRADPIDDADYDAFLDNFSLQAGESRTGMVSRLGHSRQPDNRSLAEKYDSVLRDSFLGDFHLIVLVFGSTASDFVDAVLDGSRSQLGSYMQLLIREDGSTDTADSEFLTAHNWPRPKDRIVFACALDGTGQELGRIELDVTAKGSGEDAAEFIREHAPPIADAEKKWAAAFAEARRSSRRVWARVSQRYCGPCFRMARWLDDNRELLERDYVLLKIDNVRDAHGREVARRIVSDREHFGVPFHAIFDADENVMIDSEAPTGNIGHPASYEGRRHVKKMLIDTRTHLSPEQIDRIIETVND